MMSKLLILLFAFNICLNVSLGEEWSDEKSEIMKDAVHHTGCKRYSAHGNNYELWDQIDDFTFDNAIIKRKGDQLLEFETVVAIKANANGHILLSPTRDPPSDALAFEIVAGCCDGKTIDVRPSRGRNESVAFAHLDSNVLTSDDYTDFKITIRDGTLEFGVYGEIPSIKLSHEGIPTLNYMSLTSWGETDVKFLYDCPFYNTE